MLLQLKVLQLSVNLPLEDSQIFFLLNDKNRHNSLPDGLNYERTDEYVLMPQVTETTIPPTDFVIEIQNPEDQRIFQLYVLAISNSNSKVVLLGSTDIDIRKIMSSSFETANNQILKEPLIGVQNQNGSVSFQINTIKTHFQQIQHNTKSTESLDKEQTCSSDSYEANLNELNKTYDHQENDQFNQKTKYSYDNYYRNADYSQKIIFQEIDCQDNSDDEISNFDQKCNISQRNSYQQQQSFETSTNQLGQQKKSLSTCFLQEKLKMQSYLHRLQEADFFLIRMQQRMSLYLE